MQLTLHAKRRMAERGIPKRLVDFTRRRGRIDGDRYVLDTREVRRLLDLLAEETRLAKKVLDKGGIAVVECGDALITTFNIDQPVERGRDR